MGWSLIRLKNSHIDHKSQMLSNLHTSCSILRPLDYDSVRPPSGWCARANIGVKWDHESTTLSAIHTKIYFVSSISRNLHIISKAKPKWSFCWQISEFGCSHHPSPSMATRDARHVAIAARGYGYITAGQLIDSNQQEWYVTKILWTFPISCVRYHDLKIALPWSDQNGHGRYQDLASYFRACLQRCC